MLWAMNLWLLTLISFNVTALTATASDWVSLAKHNIRLAYASKKVENTCWVRPPVADALTSLQSTLELQGLKLEVRGCFDMKEPFDRGATVKLGMLSAFGDRVTTKRAGEYRVLLRTMQGAGFDELSKGVFRHSSYSQYRSVTTIPKLAE